MTEEKKDNSGPAFPVQHYVNSDGETVLSEPIGLTKREYFAAMAMWGLLFKFGTGHRFECARASIEYADSLIAELKK